MKEPSKGNEPATKPTVLNEELEKLANIEETVEGLRSEAEESIRKIRDGFSETVIMFIDMAGSSTYKLEQLNNPEKWILRAWQYSRLLTKYVHKAGGRVIKYVGDEVMAAFEGDRGVPNAMSLLVDLRQIQENLSKVAGVSTQVRVGLDYGPVCFLGFEGHNEPDPFGTPVDRCARLTSLAAPGTILASRDLVNLAKAWMWTHLGQHEMKGLGTQDIYQHGAGTVTLPPELPMPAQEATAEKPVTAPVPRKVTKAPAAGTPRREGQTTIYWAAPHTRVRSNTEVKDSLTLHGIEVLLPGELVPAKLRKGERSSPAAKKKVCMDGIVSSDCLVVDLDSYGLDTAWEVGFCEAQSRPVFGLARGQALESGYERLVQRRRFDENFMHGWHGEDVLMTPDLDTIAEECRGKDVYVCGSFRNSSAIQTLKDSRVKTEAHTFINPKDYFEAPDERQRDSWFRSREHHISYLNNCDVAVVLLPRYGIDTSWQLGYLAGLGKEIVGFLGEDSLTETYSESIWDHWMVGWQHKVTVGSCKELAGVLLGYRDVGVLP